MSVMTDEEFDAVTEAITSGGAASVRIPTSVLLQMLSVIDYYAEGRSDCGKRAKMFMNQDANLSL